MLTELFCVIGVFGFLIFDFWFVDYLTFRCYEDRVITIKSLYPDGSPERDLALDIVRVCFDTDGRFTLRLARKKNN